MTNLFKNKFGFAFGAGQVIPLAGGDVDTRSVVFLQHGALDVPDAEFEFFWKLMDKVPETPNPMNKKLQLCGAAQSSTDGT